MASAFLFFCTLAKSKGNWWRNSSKSISHMVNAEKCQLALAQIVEELHF